MHIAWPWHSRLSASACCKADASLASYNAQSFRLSNCANALCIQKTFGGPQLPLFCRIEPLWICPCCLLIPMPTVQPARRAMLSALRAALLHTITSKTWFQTNPRCLLSKIPARAQACTNCLQGDQYQQTACWSMLARTQD